MNASVPLFLCALAGLPTLTAPGQLAEQSRQTALMRPEAVSLMGTPLYPPELPAHEKENLLARYLEAKAVFDNDPTDVEAIIWLGRRAAYLWRYREAIDVFSAGIRLFPDEPRLYRHRGHRYITVREFGKAIRDLRRAAELIYDRPDEIEPDGMPNARNIPTSTLQSNIWYHLGLAYYFEGDFAAAVSALQECMKVSANDDMICATSDWLFMSLKRMGRHAEAAGILDGIHKDMNIIENFSYHKRLMMYKGAIPPDSLLNENALGALDLATQGYGVANWYLVQGNKERAQSLFNQVLQGSYWPAFGYIGAEAELARERNGE